MPRALRQTSNKAVVLMEGKRNGYIYPLTIRGIKPDFDFTITRIGGRSRISLFKKPHKSNKRQKEERLVDQY